MKKISELSVPKFPPPHSKINYYVILFFFAFVVMSHCNNLDSGHPPLMTNAITLSLKDNLRIFAYCLSFFCHSVKTHLLTLHFIHNHVYSESSTR